MQAIQLGEYGDPDVLELIELDWPEAEDGFVVVEHEAIAVNFKDIYERTGTLFRPELPYVPGYEAVGIVREVGAGVTHTAVGDRVGYITAGGAYAEAALVDAEILLPIPDALTPQQGAALLSSGSTVQMLIERSTPVAGQTVIVHAAAGSVGLILTQWLAHLGVTVIATVSSEAKAKIAKEAGAAHVVLYTSEDFVAEARRITGGEGVDIVYDAVGHDTFDGSLASLRIGGHLVLYGFSSGMPKMWQPFDLVFGSHTLTVPDLIRHMNDRAERIERVTPAFEGLIEGWLDTGDSMVFPISRAADAHRALESRQSTGKILLEPDSAE